MYRRSTKCLNHCTRKNRSLGWINLYPVVTGEGCRSFERFPSPRCRVSSTEFSYGISLSERGELCSEKVNRVWRTVPQCIWSGLYSPSPGVPRGGVVSFQVHFSPVLLDGSPCVSYRIPCKTWTVCLPYRLKRPLLGGSSLLEGLCQVRSPLRSTQSRSCSRSRFRPSRGRQFRLPQSSQTTDVRHSANRTQWSSARSDVRYNRCIQWLGLGYQWPLIGRLVSVCLWQWQRTSGTGPVVLSLVKWGSDILYESVPRLHDRGGVSNSSVVRGPLVSSFLSVG